MFQGIFKMAALSILQKWFNPQASSAATLSPAFPAIQPNTDRIKILAVKYVTLSILAFLNFQLFVGGVIVTAVAMAHSYDVYHVFQATSVFWTGLIIAFTALALGAFCGYFLVSAKVTQEDLVVALPEIHGEPPGVFASLVQPFLEGVFVGLMQPRARHTEEATDRTSAA